MLVLKYESNGSLDNHLSNRDLTWIQRLQICLDAAHGLQYIHEEVGDVGDEYRILHRDVKSSNILLDDNFKAKVSDFGLSRRGPANRRTTYLISSACGTPGYIDPDYLTTGYLSQKSDVYSFGVVLFEVLCGRLIHAPEYKGDKREFLTNLVKIHWERKTLDEIVFPHLERKINRVALLTFANIAYQCWQSRNDRPTMKKVVEQLHKALDNQLVSCNPLRAGITNDQIGRLVKKQTDMIKRKRATSAYDPTIKLSDMRICLTYMERYMRKECKPTHGYYDSYRYANTKEEIVKKQTIFVHQVQVNVYWKKLVEEKKMMPQKEGVKLRKRWLLGGTNYRRIVEPLDIAEYYIKGNRNYIENRSNHYILLEKWLDEDKNENERRSKAPSLTEDSCFWAHVEEALISLRNLLTGGPADVVVKELKKFDAYVMGEINNYSVSPDVFLDGSSLMKWWKEYKAYKGNAFASEFAKYIDNESYKNYH
ncbi:hypothetical protein QVD17_09720 [Tagetes erecta]|uniref:Protein kinase domain-containing protein n=1 Tax=Tagetes erecta TaxID=13708 RepID=A0AAD8L1Z1_TARER|nr:hypothetical protein QVD17_09720 [Tagetes erecta]